MKKSIIAYTGWLLLLSAFAFYAYGIYEAIRISWGKGPSTQPYNEVLSAAISSIQALLLTNLGVLLGISVAKPESGVARQLMLTRASDASVQHNTPPPLELKEKVQLAALVIYLASLICCVVAWIIDDFSSDLTRVTFVVSSSGKMFIGVLLGYLTAILSR